MFRPRSTGSTLRRSAAVNEDRKAEAALHNPHGSGQDTERFDPEFRVAMKCGHCGKIAYGPRKYMREAMKEHWESDCPARHTKVANETSVMQTLYPKQ